MRTKLMRAWIVLTCLAAALLLGAWAYGPTPCRAYSVLLVGDSIFSGKQGAPASVPVGARLAIELGHRYSVINLACGGSTAKTWNPGSDRLCPRTGDGPPFSSRVVPLLPVDWLVILLGTNDSGYWFPPRPAADVGVDYAAMAEEALVHGARRVMFVIPPPRPPGVPGGARRAALEAYREEIHNLCGTSRRIVCGPDLLNRLSLAEDFEPGNVHPNGLGHAKIARWIADLVLVLDRRGKPGAAGHSTGGER